MCHYTDWLVKDIQLWAKGSLLSKWINTTLEQKWNNKKNVIREVITPAWGRHLLTHINIKCDLITINIAKTRLQLKQTCFDSNPKRQWINSWWLYCVGRFRWISPKRFYCCCRYKYVNLTLHRRNKVYRNRSGGREWLQETWNIANTIKNGSDSPNRQ